MTVATDGKGNYFTQTPAGEWVPTQMRKDETGAEMVRDGGEWKPLPVKKPEPSTPSADAAAMSDVPGAETAPPPPVPAPLARIGQAVVEGAQAPAFLTPAAKAAAEAENQKTWVGRNVVSPLVATSELPFRVLNAIGGGIGQAAYEGGRALGGPEAGRDAFMLNQLLPVLFPGAPILPREGAPPGPPPGGRFVSERMAPAPVPGASTLDRMTQLIRHDDAELAGKPAEPPPANVPGEPQPGMGPRAAGADVTTAPIPEPTPAQKATALQKMTQQSAEDRLTPQGRDDATYFPGVVRPEAMRDFTYAPEGEMSSALQHKTLYNTDSHYHDQFDAQVKANNAVMTDGTRLADGTRVEGLKDMFGDANARDAAMNEARELMPGSVGLFDGEIATNVQPIADKVNEILASGKGKIDAVANNLRPILKKLFDAEGNLETLPSQIKGIYDDINNKLYDKSPTKEGNEARQASDQLKAVKAIVSEVIGRGLPGTKWSDYNTNLSAALGKVNKLDYLQQYLTGSKNLWGRDGMLQFGKVSKMLEDIEQRHADPTGGARQLTMDEINKIEAVRNELAAKDHLDRRAGVRASPTTQLTSAAGILGSGPLGSAVKAGAEAGAHLLLAPLTGGTGNVALMGLRGIQAGRAAAAAKRVADKLTATKERLLGTPPPNDLMP